MNSLVLIPGKAGLRYSRVSFDNAGLCDSNPTGADALRGTTASVGAIRAVMAATHDDRAMDVLTIRAVFGGRDFASPVILDGANQAKLLLLGAQSPMSVASTTSLIADARTAFPKTPIALAFETSFFVDLPHRETTYALPITTGPVIRRWGYHGLFHAAATEQLAQTLGCKRRPARMLSICLDSRPEMAAVQGRTPLLVTSGSTPMEGLPGEFNCGEIDPAIVLALAADPAQGPERANLLLTRESGFFGMLGRPATLGQVLTDKRARIARVREHLLYHMGLAAGSSLAALEDLDGVVFSGRYAEHGDKVAHYLIPRLERTLDLPSGSLPWHICRTPLDAIVAEAGIAALLASGGRSTQRACSS
jgi:acetate kinase